MESGKRSKFICDAGIRLSLHVELAYINADKDFFRLSGKSVTNPYGDRNLEQAADLPYEVTQQLTDEARVALRKNKYPAKPDLPKLIKVVKEKGGFNQ